MLSSRPVCRGRNVSRAGALEIIEIVERPGDRFADRHYPVVAHEQNRLVSHQPRDAFCLIIETHAVEVLVDGYASPEPHGILVDRRKRRIGEASKHRGISGVNMKQAARMPHAPVDATMERPGRGIGSSAQRSGLT